jgi:hypothetical protein
MNIMIVNTCTGYVLVHDNIEDAKKTFNQMSKVYPDDIRFSVKDTKRIIFQTEIDEKKIKEILIKFKLL